MNGAQLATGLGHGKIILLGEHSVVHGRPAIAAGLARGCTATAHTHDEHIGHADHAEPAGADGSLDSLTVEPWGVRVHAARPEADPERELLRRAFALLRAHEAEAGAGAAGLHVHAHMHIPSGAGLGSSAALSVAVIRAMAAARGHALRDDDILSASLAWERVFHGNPSGVDSALAMRGGLARYVRTARGPSLTPVQAARPLPLVIGNSGEHGSTKATVAHVAQQLAQDPARVEPLFDRIAELVEQAERAVGAGDLEQLGPRMSENHELLQKLQLSTDKLDRMCQLALGAGALGAKLTGGGGGGCMIALARDVAAGEVIAAALSAAGYAAFIVEVSA